MKIKKTRDFLCIWIFLLIFFVLGKGVYAEETDGIPEELLQEIEEENVYTDDIGGDILFS